MLRYTRAGVVLIRDQTSPTNLSAYRRIDRVSRGTESGPQIIGGGGGARVELSQAEGESRADRPVLETTSDRQEDKR